MTQILYHNYTILQQWYMAWVDPNPLPTLYHLVWAKYFTIPYVSHQRFKPFYNTVALSYNSLLQLVVLKMFYYSTSRLTNLDCVNLH